MKTCPHCQKPMQPVKSEKHKDLFSCSCGVVLSASTVDELSAPAQGAAPAALGNPVVSEARKRAAAAQGRQEAVNPVVAEARRRAGKE